MTLSSHLIILKDHGADIDITKYAVHTQAEFTGTEEVSNATILLSAKSGRFLTINPKIQHFDRIFLRFTDPNGNIEEGVFEVIKIKPLEKTGRGRQLQLFLTHQSWYVWQDHFIKQFQRSSGFEVVEDICNSYNSNPGLSQPIIANQSSVFNGLTEPNYKLQVGNGMSKATFNDYDFGNSQRIDYDGILAVVDKLGAPVAAGGELEFYEVIFKSAYDHAAQSGLDTIKLACFASGFKNGSLITIDKALGTPKVLDTDGNLESILGTNILAWGDPSTGSNPTDFSIYVSEKEFFQAAKLYDTTITYKTDMRVQKNGVFYKAIAAVPINTPPPNATYWSVDIFAPTKDYSPWTKSKAQYWINCGAAAKDAGTVGGRAGCVDQNLVVRDDNHRRTWVDYVATNPASINSTVLISGLPYRGLRVLCNGTGVGGFSGNDINGKAFTNAVIQYNGTQWIVFVSAVTDLEVFDFYEGKSYAFRSGSWQVGAYDALGVFLAANSLNCYHRYSILGVNNPEFGNKNGIEPAPFGNNSSVYVKFDFTNPFLYEFPNNIFCGINFAFPFPKTSNAIPFGAVAIGEKYRPETLDRNNMHLTHNNNRGFNQGLESEDYGPLNAIAFYQRFILKTVGGLVVPKGDFKFRIVLYDTSDNVVVADYTHPHNDNDAEIIIPFDNFRIYRARPSPAFFPVTELEVLNIFEWRNIIRGSIFCMESYDAEGRFAGVISPLFSSTGSLGGSAELQVDGFRFIKPLLVTSQEQSVQASKPARNLQPKFLQRPQIFNYKQLKNDVNTMLNIFQFKRVEYQIRTAMKCDVHFGEHFYYKNAKLIDTTTDGFANTEKLVAKKIIYTAKRGKGEGGYHRLLIGAKRFLVL